MDLTLVDRPDAWWRAASCLSVARVVDVVDLMRLVPATEPPLGLSDRRLLHRLARRGADTPAIDDRKWRG